MYHANVDKMALRPSSMLTAYAIVPKGLGGARPCFASIYSFIFTKFQLPVLQRSSIDAEVSLFLNVYYKCQDLVQT